MDAYDMLLDIRRLILGDMLKDAMECDTEQYLECTDSDTVPDVLFSDENAGRYETN